MQVATVEEVQVALPEMLRLVGNGEEIFIVSAGKVVGRLMPPTPLPIGVPIAGRGKGQLTIYVDDDEHLKDFEEYMP